jgi:hypothetical protein
LCRARLSKKNLEVRGERKTLAQEIKQMEDDFKKRVEAEMKQFREWQASHGQGEQN